MLVIAEALELEAGRAIRDRAQEVNRRYRLDHLADWDALKETEKCQDSQLGDLVDKARPHQNMDLLAGYLVAKALLAESGFEKESFLRLANGLLVTKERESIQRVKAHLLRRELLKGTGKAEAVDWVLEILDRNVFKWMLGMERAGRLVWAAELRLAVLGDKHLWTLGEKPALLDRHFALGVATLGRQDMWCYLAVTGSQVPAHERGLLVQSLRLEWDAEGEADLQELVDKMDFLSADQSFLQGLSTQVIDLQVCQASCYLLLAEDCDSAAGVLVKVQQRLNKQRAVQADQVMQVHLLYGLL